MDAGKTAAIGYYPGGGYVLERARTGADFKAVVVLHVTNPNPVDSGASCNIRGRILAIHGSADPITPKPMIDALQDELTRIGRIVPFATKVLRSKRRTLSEGQGRYLPAP